MTGREDVERVVAEALAGHRDPHHGHLIGEVDDLTTNLAAHRDLAPVVPIGGRG